MRRKEGRTIGLYFKISPIEMALIETKMGQAGTLNKRAYLQEMAVDGYIVHVDMGSVKELVRLLGTISRNVNQIAKRCNETRNLYGEDVEDLKRDMRRCRGNFWGWCGSLPNCDGVGLWDSFCACLFRFGVSRLLNRKLNAN